MVQYKKKAVKKVQDLSIITPDRLKPCIYCRVKVTYRNSGYWRFLGCANVKCLINPRVLYKKEEEQEVFAKWNAAGGDSDNTKK